MATRTCNARESLLLVLALVPALAGCASEPAPRAARERIGDSALFIAPVLDRTGSLSQVELVQVEAELAKALLERARVDEKRRRPALKLANREVDARYRLAVTIDDLDPDGALALRLLVGLGTGRPAFRATVSLRSTAGATSLGESSFERTSSRYLEPDGKKAMLLEIAETAARFVARRR